MLLLTCLLISPSHSQQWSSHQIPTRGARRLSRSWTSPVITVKGPFPWPASLCYAQAWSGEYLLLFEWNQLCFYTLFLCEWIFKVLLLGNSNIQEWRENWESAWFNFLTPSPFLFIHFPLIAFFCVTSLFTAPSPYLIPTLFLLPTQPSSSFLSSLHSYPSPSSPLILWTLDLVLLSFIDLIHFLLPLLLLQTFLYLPPRFFLSSSIILLPTPLLIFSVPLPSHPTPLPFLSSLFTTPCLPPPTDLPLSSFTLFRFPYSPLILHSPPFTPYTPPIDLPLSSFTLFPFLLHHSPFHRSPHILRSHLFTPYTPPIPLPPLTTPCPSSSYRPSPIFLYSFSFPPPSFSFLPLSSYSPFPSLHTLHPSHFPPPFHCLMSFLLLQTIPSLVSSPFLSLPCHAPSGHQCLIFHMPSPSALFLPEYNCVTITVKLTRFSIKLLSGFIIEQEEQAKQSLCESLHNKLLSVQSALKVCVWLSIVFFSYQFPSRPNNNNNLADRAYTYQRIISVEKRDW